MTPSRRVEVKLPAEDVDRFQRPQFITTNDAGMEVCANRLSCTFAPLSDSSSWPQFDRAELTLSSSFGPFVARFLLSHADLVAKGAVLPKGERLRSRFCKFVKGAFLPPSTLSPPTAELILRNRPDPHDSIFTAQLFVSDSEELYR